MEFDSVIKRRSSVRNFNSKKTKWDDALEAIDSAIQGPFSGNINNLKFIIVEDPKKIKELAKHSSQSWIANSKLIIVICSDDTHLENQYGERGRIYNKQQSGAAISTLILKLTDLGISSCWVGAYTDEFVKNSLEIPEHINIEAIVPTGYKKENLKTLKKRKRALENCIRWNSWKEKRRPSLFEESKEQK